VTATTLAVGAFTIRLTVLCLIRRLREDPRLRMLRCGSNRRCWQNR
jgi:hypothetical protein